MNAKHWWSFGFLGTIILALILVGLISGTLIRHIVQVAPAAILAAIAFAWRPPGWLAAALAIHLFWLTIMLLIWLYLTGVAHIITGHFSAAEVDLTVAIGIANVAGSVLAVANTPPTTWRVRLAAFIIAAIVQVGAMWASLQPAVAPT